MYDFLTLFIAAPFVGSAQFFRDIAPYPGHKAMWTFLKDCLSFCLNTHELCSGGQDTNWLPKRLLLLESCDTGQRIKLVEARGRITRKRYLALSHCWGSSPGLRATQDTLEKCKFGLKVDELPATYRDCAIVATQLNVPYIWIDALCIIQDDENDWAQQSQEMNLVYENSLLMVAACASPNSATPFLGPDAPSTRLHSAAFVVGDGGDDHVNPPIRLRDTRLLGLFSNPRGPLEGRGWTWQERKLSIRQVNFLETQIVWTCREAKFHEHGMIDEYDQIFWSNDDSLKGCKRGPEKPLISFNHWQRHVVEYAPKNLTYASDRLPAISGMASRFQAVLQGTYLAGLWQEEFPFWLGWYADRRPPGISAVNSVHSIDSCAPVLDNHIPTWSWASISGGIGWPPVASSGRRPHITLLRAVCQPSTANRFGEVQSGSYLEVQGRCIEAEMECDGHGYGVVRRRGLSPRIVVLDCRLTRDPAAMSARLRRTKVATMDPATRNVGLVTCLLLFSYGSTVVEVMKPRHRPVSCTLILSKTPGEDIVFERIAIGQAPQSTVPRERRQYLEHWTDCTKFGQWEDWETWFADAVTSKIRIV